MSRRRRIAPYARGAALAIIALGFALRCWVVVAAAPTALFGDEAAYWSRAKTVLATGDPGTAFQPPGMAYAVALSRWIAPDDLTTARAQSLAWYALGAASLVALAGAWDRALVPLGVYALHPVLVGFSGFLWNESLFLALLLAAFALATRGGGWRAAGAGATFGLAALVRQVGLTFFVLALARRLWDAWPSRPRLRSGALMAVAFVAVVAPWPMRNWIVLGKPVYTTSAGYSLWASNERDVGPPYAWQYLRLGIYASHYNAMGDDELSRDAEAYRRGRAFIAAEMPGWIVKKTTVGLAHLYEPDNFVLRRVRLGHYGTTVLPWLPLLGVITLGGELIVLVWGAYVMLSLRDRAATAMVLAMTIANAAIQVATVAHARHRLVLGLLPLVVTGVARKPFSAWRLAAAVAIVAVLTSFGIRSPGWDQLARTFSGDPTVEQRPLAIAP